MDARSPVRTGQPLVAHTRRRNDSAVVGGGKEYTRLARTLLLVTRGKDTREGESGPPASRSLVSCVSLLLDDEDQNFPPNQRILVPRVLLAARSME